MKRQLYPAVLERGPKERSARVSRFPAASPRKIAGANHREGGKRAGAGGRWLFEHAGRSLPTPIERIVLPKGLRLSGLFTSAWIRRTVGAGKRLLAESLIGQIDRRAAELGMSRSSFFGLAASTARPISRPHCGSARSCGAPLEGAQDGRLRTKTCRKSRRCNGRCPRAIGRRLVCVFARLEIPVTAQQRRGPAEK